MRVFISWSGPESAEVARAVRDWLPNVVPGVRAWMSSEDIREGARWGTELSAELDRANVGVICVTRENASSDWLLYEAGAIGKHLASSRVIPILIGMGPEALPAPLRQFQAIKWGSEAPRQLAEAINAAMGTDRIRESELVSRLKQHPLSTPRVQSQPARAKAATAMRAPTHHALRVPLDPICLEILRLAAEAPETRFSDSIDLDDVSDELDLPKKKTTYFANQLAEQGLLKRHRDGSFEITHEGTAELIKSGLL